MKAQEEIKILSPTYEFSQGSTEYLFANKVKLREAPSKTAKVIELLPAGSEVTILEKTINYELYEGIESPWYLVNVNGKIGYILGGLIALDKLNSPEDGNLFLFQIRKLNDEKLYLKIRPSISDETQEFIHQIPSYHFTIEITNNRGLNGIQNLISIDYIAEACGVEGGLSYLTWDGSSLKLLATLSEIGDAGVYYVGEKFTFPLDKDGIENKIIYTKEEETVDDFEEEWTTIIKTTRVYKWENVKMIPKFENGQ